MAEAFLWTLKETMLKHRQYTCFYIFSRATLNEPFTAKYDGVLPRRPYVRPKSEIYSPKRDDEHPHPLKNAESLPGAIMSVLRFTKSRYRNTVWRPFYPLIRNNMTQNTVRDSRESPDKQQTGMLNRLAYLIYSKCSAQLHVYIISSIQEFHWC